MFRFSVYLGDKYDFKEQLEICRSLGVNDLELGESFQGSNFYSMDETEFRRNVIKNRIYIPALNLKYNDYTRDLNYIKEIIAKCGLFHIEYLNLRDFNCFDLVEEHWFDDIIAYAQIYNVKICIENCFGGYFNQAENLDSFFRRYNQEEVAMAFNPLEIVKTKKHPFFGVFYKGRFKKYISFLRISDGIYLDGSPKLPGEGNAEIKELTSALITRNYKGYLSIIPYFNEQTIADYEMIFKLLNKLLLNM